MSVQPAPDREITLHLMDGKSVRPAPSGPLFVGQKVRYTSPDGHVRIVFPDASPYTASEVHDAHVHELRQPGHFTFHCFITPHGQTQEIGWSPQDPDAGGDHDVQPPPPPV